ncbi:MAG: hypothetical protein HC890_07695 [Chloroflexaceae bacterium]|nr:hypothetical protein [Chloroflexaceae bacterium]
MSRDRRSNSLKLGIFFLSALILTLVVYVLRGMAILSFIPGGLILLLLAITLFSGLAYGIALTNRY